MVPTGKPAARAKTQRASPRRKAAPAATIDLTAPAQPALPLPHERDERVGMTGGTPSPRVQQGARDVKRGVLDTSRAPEAEAAYQRLKRPPARGSR